MMFFFFFSSRRRHTRLQGDWSSDVCSSDLPQDVLQGAFSADRKLRRRHLATTRARRDSFLERAPSRVAVKWRMLYRAVRPLLFALDPETAHRLSLKSLDVLTRLGAASLVAFPAPRMPVRVMGLDFPNPVGLAAGLDKDGEHIDALAALGFGVIELGAVTPRAQAGNPKPRLFRLPEAQALINRLGFNNDGVDALAANVGRL